MSAGWQWKVACILVIVIAWYYNYYYHHIIITTLITTHHYVYVSLHTTTLITTHYHYYINYYTWHRMQKCGVAVEGCAAPPGCTIEFSDLTCVPIQYLNETFKLNLNLIYYVSIFYVVCVYQYNIIDQFSILFVWRERKRERASENERERER